MKAIYKKCADVMAWIVKNKKVPMPVDVFANICEEDVDNVLSELKRHDCIFFSNKKTVWSIKINDAGRLLDYYLNLSK